MLVELIRDSEETARLIFRYKRGSPPPVRKVAYLLFDLRIYGWEMKHIEPIHEWIVATIYPSA